MHDSTQSERRTRRSDDTMTALHYQLAFARHQGEFDAMVLADSSGCVVAGAGAWATCELLAAYAPLLAHDDAWGAPVTDVETKNPPVAGGEAPLCARGGGPPRPASMTRAAIGCQRILQA